MKKKILGLPVVVLVLALMVVGGASAALVSYLSNTTTVTVAVESPLSVAVAPAVGGSWKLTQDFGTVYGGDTVAWRTQVINNANAPISGNLVTTIMNGGSVTCGDFTALRFYDPGTTTWTDVIGAGLCDDNATPGRAIISIPVVYVAGETEVYPANMTFNPAVAPANYIVSSQVMVAP